jgi:hypothetical protein
VAESGSYIYLTIKPGDIVKFSEFIGWQNSVFERTTHMLLLEPIKFFRYEDKTFLVCMSVNQQIWGVLPIISFIPKLLAWAALQASYKFQHKLKGGFYYASSAKAAAFFLQKVR